MRCGKSLRRSLLALAVSGAGVVPTLEAAVVSLDWSGSFTMLNRFGASLMNTSINGKVANQFQTPISGTLTIDTAAQQGSLTIVPFDWQNQPASLPMTFYDIQFEMIGDGAGGEGTLALGNMLYSWNAETEMPVSIVWDMAGLLGEIAAGVSPGDVISGVGVAPASDGTYTTYDGGTYLDQGASPVATTSYNTTNVAGCVNLDCQGFLPSGTLPLLDDTTLNEYKSTDTELVYGIGGSPVMDGGWQFKSFNLDVNTLTVTTLAYVPLPPAAWLFGSGFLWLVGYGRRYRAPGVRSGADLRIIHECSFR